MTWDWKHLFLSVLRPKDYIKPACPVCHELLKEVPGTDTRECKNGHRFGPDMKRVELINEGDFHGDL